MKSFISETALDNLIKENRRAAGIISTSEIVEPNPPPQLRVPLGDAIDVTMVDNE